MAAVEQGPWDVILMDVRMTAMDGMEALKRIHALNPAIGGDHDRPRSVDSAVAAIKRRARLP